MASDNTPYTTLVVPQCADATSSAAAVYLLAVSSSTVIDKLFRGVLRAARKARWHLPPLSLRSSSGVWQGLQARQVSHNDVQLPIRCLHRAVVEHGCCLRGCFGSTCSAPHSVCQRRLSLSLAKVSKRALEPPWPLACKNIFSSCVLVVCKSDPQRPKLSH